MKSYTITNHCFIFIKLKKKTHSLDKEVSSDIRPAQGTRSQSARTNPLISDEYSHWCTNQNTIHSNYSLYYIGKRDVICLESTGTRSPILSFILSFLIYILKTHFNHVHVQRIPVHEIKCDLKRGNCGYFLARSHPHRCITPIRLIKVTKKEKARWYIMET